jgi:hypothetical protein
MHPCVQQLLSNGACVLCGCWHLGRDTWRANLLGRPRLAQVVALQAVLALPPGEATPAKIVDRFGRYPSLIERSVEGLEADMAALAGLLGVDLQARARAHGPALPPGWRGANPPCGAALLRGGWTRARLAWGSWLPETA